MKHAWPIGYYFKILQRVTKKQNSSTVEGVFDPLRGHLLSSPVQYKSLQGNVSPVVETSDSPRLNIVPLEQTSEFPWKSLRRRGHFDALGGHAYSPPSQKQSL